VDDNKPDKPAHEVENPKKLPDLEKGDDDLHKVDIHEEQAEPKAEPEKG
jgi:hypothetical protein